MRARRTGFALAALLLASSAGVASSVAVAQAQGGGPPLGLRLGITGARLHGSLGDDIASGYRAGLDLGVSTRVPIGPALAFQPELQWIVKGGRDDFAIDGAQAHADFSLRYVEAPLLLRVVVPVAGAWEPFFLVGPAFAWRVDDDVDVKLEQPVPTASDTREQRARIFERVGTLDNPNFSDWDFGVLGGAGVIMGRGRVRYSVEARYQRGFVNLYDTSDAEATTGAFVAAIGVELR